MLSEAQHRLLLETADNASSRLRSELRKGLPHQGVDNQVVWRIKSNPSILRKVANRRALGVPEIFINDLIGLRVIVSHAGMIKNTTECVNNWILREPNYCLMGIHDYFNHTRSPYYRSVHFDLLLALPDHGQPDKVGMEIQVTTYMQNYLAAISHDLLYKAPRSKPEMDQGLLDEIQRHIEQVDAIVASAFSKRE